MFKRNKIYTVVAASALISVSAMSTAQESVTTTTQVEVSDSFTVSKDSDLSFGTLAIIQSLDTTGAGGTTPLTGSANVASYVVNADGTTTVNDPATPEVGKRSSITEIVAGTPATYSISAAARFTEVYVRLNSTGTGAPDSFAVTPDFTVDAADNVELTGTLAFTNTLITAASANQGVALVAESAGAYQGLAPIRTDGTGTASFAVGATLTPELDAVRFPDGTYSGTFDVTVNY